MAHTTQGCLCGDSSGEQVIMAVVDACYGEIRLTVEGMGGHDFWGCIGFRGDSGGTPRRSKMKQIRHLVKYSHIFQEIIDNGM